MGGENKKLEYLESMHPFGMVPVLIDDDGSKVYESQAMARYIVTKYAPDGGIVPKDLKKNVSLSKLCPLNHSTFIRMHSLWLQESFLTSNETAAECAKNLEEKLAAYEHILSKQKYLAGEEFTLADLFHLPLGYILIGFNGLKATTNLARWWTEISSRPAWKQVREEVENFMAQMTKK